jgi:hypothetical protein
MVQVIADAMGQKVKTYSPNSVFFFHFPSYSIFHLSLPDVVIPAMTNEKWNMTNGK